MDRIGSYTPPSYDPYEGQMLIQEGQLRLESDNLEINLQGLNLLGERLQELYRDSDWRQSDIEEQRKEISKLGLAGTALSSIGATAALGAAFASGAGELAMLAAGSAAIITMAHQFADHYGLYRELSKQMGGKPKEIEERSDAIKSGMGLISLGGSLASLFVGDGASAWEGLKWATSDIMQGLSRAAATAQGLLTIRQIRSDNNKLSCEIELKGVTVQLALRRLEQDALKDDVQESLRIVEKAIENVAATANIRSRIAEELAKVG